MTKHTWSILLAFLLFAAPVWAQMAQPIEARKPSNNPPEVQSNGCGFQDSNYCEVFARRPRGRINIPRRHQVDTFGGNVGRETWGKRGDRRNVPHGKRRDETWGQTERTPLFCPPPPRKPVNVPSVPGIPSGALSKSRDRDDGCQSVATEFIRYREGRK
jgi:hypothetical protein